MPKATLEFNLPEEQDEHIDAINGSKYRCALWDISQMFRHQLKWGELSDEKYEMVEELQKEFYAFLEVWDVNLDN